MIGLLVGGCNREYSRQSMLDRDFDVPQDDQRCKKTADGLFSWEWTKASVSLDTSTK